MGALSHLRIVEIGSAAATSYCARLFADFGAAVQKIEPPAGDPLRRAAPLTPKGNSAWFAFLNFNKSSIALDPDDSKAVSRLTELIGGCDILLDGRDVDAADCPEIDLAELKRRHPGLIHLEASWFGGEGPYAKFEATDSTIRALVGLVKLVGPAEGTPMHAPDFQTGIFAGLWGFIAAASSVLGRMQDGHGRSSRLSIFESSIAVTEYIMFEAFSRGDLGPIVAPIVPLAMADGLAAIKHVRQHAKDYAVNPQRIGIMGFSAGGTVASSVAYNYTAESRPDFVAPIYLAYSWTIKTNGVPADAPPMFILAATDDPLKLAAHSVDLYRDWIAARKPAELHMFARGGHGFGMKKQNLPTDGWIERFADWLGHQGLLKK